MKKVFRYIILLIVAFVVARLFSFLLTMPVYKDMKNYEILEESPKVEITESKASKNRGYIKGNATNDTGNLIKDFKIKFDFYNEQGSILGSEYSNTEIFNSTETIKFDIKYEYKEVSKIKISIVNE